MIRKSTFLIVLFSLVSTSAAFGETASFKVSATIPRIIGVNYFPDAAEGTASTVNASKTDFTEEIVRRNGQELVLKTSVVK